MLIFQKMEGTKQMYHIAICDDENKILEDLHSKIEACFRDNEIEADYYCTDNSQNMMEYLQKEKVDVLFLDIDMPHISGMDIAGYLNENKKNTILFFVTSQDALVYQTFAYRPFGFIRKTHLQDELLKVIERIKKELRDRKQEITIIRGQDISRVFIKNILYLEAEGNYINIYTKEEILKIRETMTSMEKELCQKGFIRCHKGYLVNAEYIEKIRGTEISLWWEGKNVSLPIGRSYDKEVKRKLLESIRN